MKKSNISFLIIIFVIIYGYNSIYASFEPIKDTSGNRACLYSMSGEKADGTTFFEDWEPVECEKTLDFRVLLDDGEHRPDGIYTFSIKANDSNQDGDNKSYLGEAMIDKSNKYGISTWGPYKVDTTPPACILKEIRIPAGKGNNLYYSNGRLYYKSIDGVGEFRITLEADDTNNGTYPNTSKLKKIEFPILLGATPDSTIYSAPTGGKQTITGIYNWSGNNTSTGDILNNSNRNFCFDYAGNQAPLKTDANTKLIIEDGNHIITGITSLILTPDSQAPTVAGDLYNPIGNGFKYVSGNNSEGGEYTIYDGDTTKSNFFAALDTRKIIIPSFRDVGSGLKSFRVKIEKYDDKSVLSVYERLLSTKDSKVEDLTHTNIDHNFSLIDLDLNTNGYRSYSWNIETLNLGGNTIKTDEICDMVGNCILTPTPDFKVVANSPMLAVNTNLTSGIKGTRHNLNSLFTGSVSNMRSNYSDTHTTLAYFEDKYGNSIVPVFGVKDVKLEIKFDNTLGCNQLTNASQGDCVHFSFIDTNNTTLVGNIHNINEAHDFNYTLNNYSQFNGSLKIELKSAIPTKEEYKLSTSPTSLYGPNLSAKLQLTNLNIKVDNKTGYVGVGENSSALELSSSSSNKPYYKWAPVISFNTIDNIYPLVEGQEKELKIGNVVTDGSKIIGYNLQTHIGTNNFFLKFQDIKLKNGNQVNGVDNYSAYNNYTHLYTGKGIISKNSGTNTDILQFTPKTIGGINNSNTNIALYTNLKYKLNGCTPEIILPGIQTGFNSFGPRENLDFLNSSEYESESSIVLSEIDVRGMTQTRNNSLGDNSGSGAVTTDNNTFKDFSSITLYDLKTQVKKNVEQLLAGVENRNSAGGGTIASFNFNASSPGIKLQNNSVLYLRGDSTINCSGVCNISGKKTIIVENGNLFIASDMKYADNNSILGIILIGNTDSGDMSQLRISENITNGVGVVFSEGPIVSVNISNTKIYNGGNTSNTDLVNQLYWKGSFATRNTVGGSIKDGNGICPYGTPDYNKSTCTIATAQGYDLIYLRRYARVATNYYTTVAGNPMGDGKIPLNIDKKSIKIAGGDNFAQNTGIKTLGTLPKPSINNFNAPLIIEYDPRIQTYPPLGFTN